MWDWGVSTLVLMFDRTQLTHFDAPNVWVPDIGFYRCQQQDRW